VTNVIVGIAKLEHFAQLGTPSGSSAQDQIPIIEGHEARMPAGLSSDRPC